MSSCELFVQFALNPVLEIWKKYYCKASYTTCIRFQHAKSGKQVPITLLPNGKSVVEKQEQGAPSHHGTTAIFNAIQKNRVRMVGSLIKVGININAKNIDGVTPLMVAAQYGRADIVELLLQHGADKSIKNVYGLTAYDLAKQKNHLNVIGLLSDPGAEKLTGT
jgi:ankyrin repeat protein